MASLPLGHRVIEIVTVIGVTFEIVVCISDNYDSNLEVKNDFAKYLKEKCWKGF